MMKFLKFLGALATAVLLGAVAVGTHDAMGYVTWAVRPHMTGAFTMALFFFMIAAIYMVVSPWFFVPEDV